MKSSWQTNQSKACSIRLRGAVNLSTCNRANTLAKLVLVVGAWDTFASVGGLGLSQQPLALGYLRAPPSQ